MRALNVFACLATLAACGPNADQSGQDEPRAPQASTESAPRAYDAISKTAEAFSGALRISEVSPTGPNDAPSLKLITATGHVYETDFVSAAGPNDQVGITPWTNMMTVPQDARIEVHAVQSELVNPQAANGGWCAPGKTHFIALATYKDGAGQDSLQIAAFSDEKWPPDRAPALCGTFLFAPAAQ
jgi:hypothetical protein